MNGILQNSYSSALKWKFLCGSLVFLPDDPFFLEWWTVGAKPFQHYIPYNSPAQLEDRVLEYQTKLDEAAKIAKAGYDLAVTAFNNVYTYAEDHLLHYARATEGKQNRCCKSRGRRREQVVTEFKTLQDLQKEYGPSVCV
eukprot:CAMPEP_0202463700 /NCGR_PEP_ID=MMETSP1360-20130828/59175_1 /ASSEMBLY_ACC=CAM_ASM_000848 /TAXON_ID=515479 /ORGANISM="Licmophora paradoxa, Strain CCMP2313" /LENGTH=139 /DNA_ID=CAMNT_0049086703 /DNA_START=59 /DNA_END=478 /DNA_ORIENTATION=-